MTLTEWKENMIEEVEGIVTVSCVMENVPHHDNTKRFQVYNEEGTYDETFDVIVDDEGNVVEVA